MFNARIEEFEEERHVFELWRWIDAKISEMELNLDFDLEYFGQKNRVVKKIIEEAVPIAKFGLSLVGQHQDVYIRCQAGNQPFDALLRMLGHQDQDFKLEVTTTQSPETVTARQRLAKQGYVFRPSRIKEGDGWRVTSIPVMGDIVEQIDEWSDLAFSRARDKVASGRYDSNTIILVSIETWRPIPIKFRAELVQKTRNELGAELRGVHDVCYVHKLGVDAVKRGEF